MKRHAFSLIELLVVVAIIGVLAAIAFPVYKSYFIKAKITKSVIALDAIVTQAMNYADTKAFFQIVLN